MEDSAKVIFSMVSLVSVTIPMSALVLLSVCSNSENFERRPKAFVNRILRHEFLVDVIWEKDFLWCGNGGVKGALDLWLDVMAQGRVGPLVTICLAPV